MSKPVPSPTEQAAINAQIATLNAQALGLAASVSNHGVQITQNQLVDQAFADLFNWYNDQVIGKYDAERKAINGTFVASPITNTDILNLTTNPPSGRLVPTAPATAVVRIAEFDGTVYTASTTDNELQNLSDEEPWITYLSTGVSGTLATVTATTFTTTTLNSLSTTLGVSDASGPAAFIPGDILLIHNGGTDAAVVQVTSVTPLSSPPPYDFTLGIQVKIPPSGTLAIGSTITTGFTGFTNSERTAKVASNSNQQPIMNTLIASIQAALNARLLRLTSELSALNTNDDPDGIANITTAKNNATTAQSFINTYLLTTDISNTGLSSLSAERTSRTTYLSTRISQIIAAYTGQTENYYDKRYFTANARGDLAEGTLKTLVNSQNIQSEISAMIAPISNKATILSSI